MQGPQLDRLPYEATFNVRASKDDPVEIAIAGRRQGRVHLSAYLATSGKFGVMPAKLRDDVCDPACEEVAEFRAAYQILFKERRQPMTIYSENELAVEWLNRWKDGDTETPGGHYAMNPDAQKGVGLTALRRMVAQRADFLTVSHAEQGNALSDGVTKLANIGLHAYSGAYPPVEVPGRLSLRQWLKNKAGESLGDYRHVLTE